MAWRIMASLSPDSGMNRSDSSDSEEERRLGTADAVSALSTPRLMRSPQRQMRSPRLIRAGSNRQNVEFIRRYLARPAGASVRKEAMADLLETGGHWMHDCFTLPNPRDGRLPPQMEAASNNADYFIVTRKEICHANRCLSEAKGSYIKFSALDVVLYKIGRYLLAPSNSFPHCHMGSDRGWRQFSEWLRLLPMLRNNGSAAINALTYFPKCHAGYALDAYHHHVFRGIPPPQLHRWGPFIWTPDLRGVGNIIAAARAGYSNEIHMLENPDGSSFLHVTVIASFLDWLQPGVAAQECIKELQRLGASTRIVFQSENDRLVSLEILCSRKMSQTVVRRADPDADDLFLYRLACSWYTASGQSLGDEWNHLGEREQWGDDSWTYLMYTTALGKLSFARRALRFWHFDEAMLAHSLMRSLAIRLGVEASRATVQFLLGQCQCKICSAHEKSVP